MWSNYWLKMWNVNFFLYFRLVGKHDSLQALVLLETHQLCCQHYTNYSSTVVKPHDGYLVLACHIYWDLWQESKEDKYMWSAVVPLYDAIHDSPASFQLKLLLVKFLNAVGAVGLSYKIHAGLELKHVQWDSLGYVLSRHIQTCGHFDTSLGLYHLILKFFNSSYKEVRRLSSTAFQIESTVKASSLDLKNSFFGHKVLLFFALPNRSLFTFWKRLSNQKKDHRGALLQKRTFIEFPEHFLVFCWQ